MTVLIQHSTQPEQPGILRRRVTGTPSEIDATVSLLRHSGALVSASVPCQVGPTDPRVTVIVRVRENALTYTPAPLPASSRPWVKPVAIAAAVLTLVAGLLIGGYLAAQQIITAATSSGSGIAAIGFLIVVAGLLLLVRAGRRSGACMGLHCSGCGHR
ncbi:hypothetical protein [Actinoplanes utahensis]|uniref:Uncharacterized protein n=1 Tax=Actinoplanes utahensis TaxID=1869 RepID=A0A0A6UK92_ACTUT|nr:hypothetical protein [Actinoplanes utahensis]KHD76545.1 hypothetical protein MB27_16195 [Actinoplanes utahensis]GIF31223.1 hypothetical protein Aut01nite_42090 [Actinoplanes utahensis]